ncbi:MAG: DNA polymerase/3'-5' exonuclease PolX [Candidatus Nealsonbacteria bacterium]|nr:DNA polymerase/3'-5' exonuclease PolX [Candidatus Nealsonbacteria bacterium]
MKNQEVANILYEIADFLDMDDTPFRPLAYKKAANSLENLEEDIETIYKRGGTKELEKISGIGEHIALRIEEYLKKGKIGYLQELRKKIPVDIENLTMIEGMGPKTVKTLYQELNIKNLKDLEKAAKEHRIAPLFGFGEKTEQNILEGIEFLKKTEGRSLLGRILPKANEIYEEIKKLPEVETISTAGSLRRMKETIGDVDLLVSSNNPKKIMDHFVSMKGVLKVWGKGETKASIKTAGGFNVDIRVVLPESYGSALQHFTGSKEHNIALRKIAMERGLKVNEYGVFKGEKRIAGKTEEEVYKILRMDWIPPEMREDQGEIELAIKGRLPQIVGYNDIKGDLHCHSSWTGGENTIEEMAKRAIELGYLYIGIADHTKFLRIENGLDEKQLMEQRKEIDELNNKIKGIKILQGCEANILDDGSIDITNEALAKLDFVIAGIHSGFKMNEKKITQRIIKAMENPHVDIISHPTGRILKRRAEYNVNIDEMIEAAKRTGTILEINSYPERLDLNDVNIYRAKRLGVKMVINTDAHHREHMKSMCFGIAQARRGWAEEKDIINTGTLKELITSFKK